MVKIEGERKKVEVKPFLISRYLVTHRQFQAFIEAKDGYRNKDWWEGLERREKPAAARWSEKNVPRETVTWH